MKKRSGIALLTVLCMLLCAVTAPVSFADSKAAVSDGYYLIGRTGWTVDTIRSADRFSENLSPSGGFLLYTTLSEGEQIKVVKVSGGEINEWYPSEAGSPYTVDAANAGDVTVYFHEVPMTGWKLLDGYLSIAKEYKITCVSGGHGRIDTLPTSAMARETVTVYVDSEEGYELHRLTRESNGTTTPITKNTWGAYTFRMPNDDVTVSAVFRKIGSAYTVSVADGIEHGTVTPAYSDALPGETVSIAVTPEADYALGSLTVKKANGEAVAVSDLSFVMPESNVTISATFKSLKPQFRTQQLVLSGSIGATFFLDLSMLTEAERENSYMEFSVSGSGHFTETVAFDEDNKNQSGQYYGFTCYVTSIQMADTITAVYHYGDGQTVSKTYSILTYLKTFDANQGSFNAKTVRLMKALSDYGHYIQIYLSESNHWTIGSDYADMDLYYSDSFDTDTIRAAAADYAMQRTDDPDIEKITYSLGLDSATEVYVYFKPVSGYKGGFSAKIDGQTAEAILLSDGRYLVRSSGISAHRLGDMIEFVATTDNGSMTVNVCPLSFVNSILKNSQNAAAQNGVCAFYAYYDAAAYYKNN